MTLLGAFRRVWWVMTEVTSHCLSAHNGVCWSDFFVLNWFDLIKFYMITLSWLLATILRVHNIFLVITLNILFTCILTHIKLRCFLYCHFIRILNLRFQFLQIPLSFMIWFSNILTRFNIPKCLILEIDSFITILQILLFIYLSIIRLSIFIKWWDLIIILISIVLFLTSYSKILILASWHFIG